MAISECDHFPCREPGSPGAAATARGGMACDGMYLSCKRRTDRGRGARVGATLERRACLVVPSRVE